MSVNLEVYGGMAFSMIHHTKGVELSTPQVCKECNTQYISSIDTESKELFRFYCSSIQNGSMCEKCRTVPYAPLACSFSNHSPLECLNKYYIGWSEMNL
jgi:hypothetical protein